MNHDHHAATARLRLSNRVALAGLIAALVLLAVHARRRIVEAEMTVPVAMLLVGVMTIGSKREQSDGTPRQAGIAVRGRASPSILDAAALDSRPFSDAACHSLFAAVLVDDDVDTHAELPDRITLDFPQSQLVDCYRLCRQLWKTGIPRSAMIALTDALMRDRDLDAAGRLRFKYARAKFKHLRFACALYSERHAYPTILDWLTTALGHLQDAFKAGRPAIVYREALLCRVFLTSGMLALLHREVDRLAPTTTAGFRGYLAREVATLEDAIAHATMTGAQFHAVRKIASRQVSFYDTLRTLAPSDEAFRMSRSLAAINGLMGSMHDDLVVRRTAGTLDYHRERFALPDDIRVRIAALIERYRMSGLV